MAVRRHRRQARRIQPPPPPPDPRRIGRALGWVLMVAFIAVAGYGGYAWVTEPENLPVRTLRLMTPLTQVTQAEVRAAVQPSARDGILYLNVDQVRAALESLPWVRRAEVRRSWPDVLSVDIEEFVPVARWGDGGLVSGDGVRFDPGRRWEGADRLPLLIGPAGAELTMLKKYREFNDHLSRAGLAVSELTMDERQAWWLRLSDGVTVALGRNGHVLRLDRLIAVYGRILKASMAKVERLDLRYTNGFSVRWREQAAQRGSATSGEQNV